MKTVRILIADDHEVVREGTRMLLEREPDWQVCALAKSGRDAVAAAEKFQPDVAILDMMMPDLNGLEALRQIKRRAPNCEVLLFTASQSEQLVRDAFEAGAKSVILKTDAALHLVAALKSLVNRKPYFTSHAAEILFERFLEENTGSRRGEDVHELTSREREVVTLLAEGKSNKEVAEALGISVRTAETHRANVLRKAGVTSLAGLVRYAIRNGIIEL
jgi:two-component system, NarL family, response regulator NreC